MRHFKLIKYKGSERVMLDSKELDQSVTLYKLLVTFPETGEGDPKAQGDAIVLSGISARELLNLYDVIRGA